MQISNLQLTLCMPIWPCLICTAAEQMIILGRKEIEDASFKVSPLISMSLKRHGNICVWGWWLYVNCN
jgi:hypothetical protein